MTYMPSKWGSRWHADPRTILLAPALTGSLPGERSSGFTILHQRTGLTALSIGTACVPSLAARSSAFVCWPEICDNTFWRLRWRGKILVIKLI